MLYLNILITSDLFVTPSVTEVFPLSTIEAIAVGLPVIGVNAPGTRDIIEDGITGLLSPAELVAFTANFIQLATNHEQRLRMGKQALLASKKYDIRIITNTLIQHYQTLIQTPKNE